MVQNYRYCYGNQRLRAFHSWRLNPDVERVEEDVEEGKDREGVRVGYEEYEEEKVVRVEII